MTVLSIFTVSCTKENLTPAHENFFSVGTEIPVGLNIGIIEDYGLVNGVARHLHTSFIDQGYILNTKTGVISGTGSQLNLGFYSNEDGVIPNGTYDFSTSVTKVPFTFDSGYITENFNLGTQEGHMHQINSGTVIVFKDGEEYDFTFDCGLDFGSRLIGTFKGTMLYFDR